jgi:hypothetical protein
MKKYVRPAIFLMILAIVSTSPCLGVDTPSSENGTPSSGSSERTRSNRSVKKYFLVRTVEGENLQKRLAKSLETVSHSFGDLIIGGDVLAEVSAPRQTTQFSLGRFYWTQGNRVNEFGELGSVCLRLGRSPITFDFREHRWMGPLIRDEFQSEKTTMTGGLKLTRETYVDRQGVVYVSFRVSGSTANGRELLTENKLCFDVEPDRPSMSRWRIWCRLPDGTLRRPAEKQGKFQCPVTSGETKNSGRDLLIVAMPMSDQPVGTVPSEEVEFESKITKRRPIGSMISSMKRWIVNQFPGWDCPEPWLNKLWAGQVVAICQSVAIDESGEPFIAIDSADDWRLVDDARWLRDGTIGRRSIERGRANLDRKNPTTRGTLCERFTPECSPGDYPAFVQWCRSFFPGGDFSWLIDLHLDASGKRIEKKIPCGVMDMIITKVVGLSAGASNRLTISPATWIGHWPYFAIDNLPYRGHNLSVVWQSPDHVQRYAEIPQGLCVFVDGQCVKRIEKLEPMEIELK